MEKFSFFNDVNDDRVYYAEDWARHLKKYFTNGIFNNELNVVSNNDMTITIKEGDANIEGYRYTNTGDLVKTIDNADGTLNRIDNVVLRLDLTNRLISAQIIKGTFADKPVAPELVRTSTIYDLRIAKISIPAGTTTITQDLITDTRFITSDCGNVISTVQTPDTENLFIQIQTLFEKQINELNNNFEIWFDSIKNQLDSDAAGNLQNQINNLNSNKVDAAKFDLDSNNLQLLANGKNVGDSVHIPTGITDTATGEEDLKIVNNRGVVKFLLEGKTNQKSYIGKNFWKLYNTQTVNGVTLTQNDDGSILLNGTATEDTFFRIILDETINETTTLSCDYKSGTISGASVYIRTRTSNNAIKYSIDVGPSTALGIQLDRKTTENYYQEITVQKGAICSNVLLEVMLLKGNYNGDTLPLFEPYVGGTQSPNPDYPQKIENIKGVENLFYNVVTNSTPSGITITQNDDGSLILNGTTTGVSIFDFKLAKTLPAGTYTFSIEGSDNISNDIFLRARGNNGQMVTNDAQVQGNNTTQNSHTFTCEKEIVKVALNITTTGKTFNNFVIKPMLSKKKSNYVPYGSNYLQLRNSSKNLLDLSYLIGRTYNGITWSKNKDGKIVMNGTSTNILLLNITTTPLKFSAGTYTHSISEIASGVFFSFDNLSETMLNGTKGIKTATWTLSEEKTYDKYYIYINKDKTFTNYVLDIQIEKGSTRTEYEPYQNQSILIDLKGNNLCSDRDKTIRDELVIENGKAKINKIIKEFTFTGDEEFTKRSDGDGSTTITFNLPIHEDIVELNTISNMFSYEQSSTSGNEGMGVSIGNNKLVYIQIKRSRLSSLDVAGFKEFLKAKYNAGTPLKIQCELIEPEVIDLGKIDFELLEGNSTLNLEEDLKSNMSIKYYTDSTVVDLKKKVENKQNVILHGTTVPSNDLGEDGDIYLQHN